MSDIFEAVLASSFYAGIVGLVILLLKGMLRNRLNAKWHYLIWSVLVLKLLVPFGPQSAVSLFNLIPKLSHQATVGDAYQVWQQDEMYIGTDQPQDGISIQPLVTDPTETMVNTQNFVEEILPFIWAAGAMIMLLWLVFSCYLLHSKLRRGSVVKDDRILRILKSCQEKMGVTGHVNLVLQDTVGTPSLFGILRPTILITPGLLDLEDKELRYIFLHELAHYKRKDVPVNYLLLIFQAIHWFNPVIWFCFASIRQDMEVAADEYVVSTLEAAEYKDYGRALLTVVERFSASRLALRLIGMVDERKNIERRLMMIKMAGFFKARRRIMLAVGLLCVVGLGGVLLTDRLAEQKSLPGSNGIYNAQKLYANKTPYVGNNSKVAGVVSNLPYAGFRREISLQTKTVPYGITVKYDFSGADTNPAEQVFFNNASIMFALIDNVDEITFNISTSTKPEQQYQYTREEIQKNYARDLRLYAADVSEFESFLGNFEFRLAVFPEKYATVMSIAPGLGLLAEYPGSVEKVRFTAQKGAFLTWDSATGKVSAGKNVIEVLYGLPVYWSPLVPDGHPAEEKNNLITVALLDKKGAKIDEKKINIVYDGTFYSVEPSPGVVIGKGPQLQTQKILSLDDAVSNAIKAQYTHYGSGETVTEGHLILDTEENSGTVKVYTIASLGAFGFENGIFTKVSGSGAIPTVMLFSLNDTGGYTLVEYREPEDGAHYTDSLKKMFPARLQGRVLSARNDYAELARQQEAQAAGYLEAIGRTAQISEGHVEKKLADIDVQAKNKLFSELTKFDPFLNACPYWLGTRETVENGIRYIYETAQSKGEDGIDLITFKKSREDGTVVEERTYKIAGSEPQLVE